MRNLPVEYMNIVIEIPAWGGSMFGRKSSKIQLFFNFDELVLEDAEIFFHFFVSHVGLSQYFHFRYFLRSPDI